MEEQVRLFPDIAVTVPQSWALWARLMPYGDSILGYDASTSEETTSKESIMKPLEVYLSRKCAGGPWFGSRNVPKRSQWKDDISEAEKNGHPSYRSNRLRKKFGCGYRRPIPSDTEVEIQSYQDKPLQITGQDADQTSENIPDSEEGKDRTNYLRPYETAVSGISEETEKVHGGPEELEHVIGSEEDHVFGLMVKTRKATKLREEIISPQSVAATPFSQLTGKDKKFVDNHVLGVYRDDPWDSSHAYEHLI